MKFLTKINRQYFLTLSILLVFVSFAGYFVLKIILKNEIKEDIREKEFYIIQDIKTRKNLPNLYPIIETKKISKQKTETKLFTQVSLDDKADKEKEIYLEYTNCVKIDNQWYLIKIRHSLIATNDLIIAIAFPLFLLLILAFIISFFTTKKLNKSLWKDFEQNLMLIENFSFKNKEQLKLKYTNIEEFDSLNSKIIKLTQKLNNDYQSLKEFTENASHELQTPLAIVLMNLEELLQHDLPEHSFKLVLSAISAIKRLSDLNKSLLLLTKIENRQFSNFDLLFVNKIVREKIDDIEPILTKDNLSVKILEKNELRLNIDKELLDIMLNNLLSNAIKYNMKNGEIFIEINNDRIKICNTGENNNLNNENIFDRFVKENSKSYGLGLSIVKQICGVCNLNISYVKNSYWHCFVITT